MKAARFGIHLGLLLAFVCSSGSASTLAPSDMKAAREAFSAGRYEDAYLLLKPEALAGEAAAQFLVGLMHRDGLGVARDIPEAQRWLRLAAAQGYEGATLVLGEIELVDGSTSASSSPARPLGRIDPAPPAVSGTVPQPEPEAAPRAEPEPVSPPPSQTPANDNGSARSEATPLTGQAHWLDIAANQGNSSAQYGLARLYESGRGAPQDVSKALTWYRRAAEQGHISAQLQAGYLLAGGQSVPPDLAEASRWYRAAAEAGDVRGQFSLAMLLERGSGEDRIEAVVWLERAVARASGTMQARVVAERDRLAATLRQTSSKWLAAG